MIETFGYLKKDSIFYGIFKDGKIPLLRTLGPVGAKLDGSNEDKIYKVDVSRLTLDEYYGIIDKLAEQFKVPTGTISDQFKKDGFIPIRASQIDHTEGDVIEMREVM